MTPYATYSVPDGLRIPYPILAYPNDRIVFEIAHRTAPLSVIRRLWLRLPRRWRNQLVPADGWYMVPGGVRLPIPGAQTDRTACALLRETDRGIVLARHVRHGYYPAVLDFIDSLVYDAAASAAPHAEVRDRLRLASGLGDPAGPAVPPQRARPHLSLLE